LDIVSSFLKEILSLEKKIKIIKQSQFYTELHNCKRVKNPIQKTNILLFDYRYNAMYRLWGYLATKSEKEVVDIDEKNENFLPVWYNLYVLITIIGALYDLGFKVLQKDCIIRCESEYLSMTKNSEWKNKNAEKIQLLYLNDKIEISICVNNTWEKVILVPDFSKDFENKYLSEIYEQTNDILTSLSSSRNKNNMQVSTFSLISIDIHQCSDNDKWGEMLYRRLFNIGDNFSPEEKNIQNLSFYKTGILIISPVNFQVNFLRIQRLINSRFLKNINSLNKNICPICKNAGIKRLNPKEIICSSCNHYFSL
jgi:hypothetical protein